MYITVFTGSSTGSNPSYAPSVARLGRELADAGVGIVYGGAHVGLMGVVADAALDAGGEVIGVIPQFLVDREVAHEGLSRLETVGSMHERKLRMTELGDAILALPGGIGTLEEFFEAWTWKILGLHERPVVLFDVDGFWDPLRTMIGEMVDRGFVRQSVADALVTTSDAAGVLEVVRASAPVRPT